MSGRHLVLCVLFVAACGGGSDDDANVPDTSDELFEPGALLEVAITMDPGDFETLRNQTRSIPDTLQGDCLAQPFQNPFTQFHADVTVDGVTYTDVSIKKKGFFGSGLGPGSIAKPGFKLDANEYLAGQKFGGPGGLDHLVLNNSVQDGSHARTCLGYQVFTAAGLDAPRCNHAHVTVNGEELGVYIHVEDVDDEFLDRHFDAPDGSLYKGILSDFRTGWTTSFDLQEGPGDADHLASLAAAAEAPQATLLGDVSAHIDYDQFLTLWAAESLLRHWDGYTGNTNNFFVYDDPDSGKFYFLPWGTDQVMQNGADSPASVYGTGALANRLYQLPEVAGDYVARMHELLDGGAWDETAMRAELDRVEALVAPVADPTGANGLAAQVADVRTFIDGRRTTIENEIIGGPATYNAPLRDPFCLLPIGHLSGTYATTWGTAGADPWTSGTGTLTATVNGNPLTFTQYGATAGYDQNDPAQASIVLFAAEPAGTIIVVLLSFRADRVAPAQSLHVDWSPTNGALYRYNPADGSFTNIGSFGIGDILVDDGATTAASVVDGSFEADLVLPPW
jgi:spore coat protein CotH